MLRRSHLAAGAAILVVGALLVALAGRGSSDHPPHETTPARVGGKVWAAPHAVTQPSAGPDRTFYALDTAVAGGQETTRIWKYDGQTFVKLPAPLSDHVATMATSTVIPRVLLADDRGVELFNNSQWLRLPTAKAGQLNGAPAHGLGFDELDPVVGAGNGDGTLAPALFEYAEGRWTVKRFASGYQRLFTPVSSIQGFYALLAKTGTTATAAGHYGVQCLVDGRMGNVASLPSAPRQATTSNSIAVDANGQVAFIPASTRPPTLLEVHVLPAVAFPIPGKTFQERGPRISTAAGLQTLLARDGRLLLFTETRGASPHATARQIGLSVGDVGTSKPMSGTAEPVAFGDPPIVVPAFDSGVYELASSGNGANARMWLVQLWQNTRPELTWSWSWSWS